MSFLAGRSQRSGANLGEVILDAKRIATVVAAKYRGMVAGRTMVTLRGGGKACWKLCGWRMVGAKKTEYRSQLLELTSVFSAVFISGPYSASVIQLTRRAFH
jgi:hypothetical protein